MSRADTAKAMPMNTAPLQPSSAGNLPSRRRHATSLSRSGAHGFAFRAPGLVLQSELLFGPGRSCPTPGLWSDGGLGDQRRQSCDGVGAISLLGAEALGGDDDDPLVGGSLAGEPLEACGHIRWKRRRAPGVEAQLRGAVELVDILSAGSRRVNEVEFQFALVHGDRVA